MIIKWHKLPEFQSNRHPTPSNYEDILSELSVPFFVKTDTGEILAVGDLNKKLGSCDHCSMWWGELTEYGIISSDTEDDPIFKALSKWLRQKNCGQFEMCKQDLNTGGAYRLEYTCECFKKICEETKNDG